MLSSATKSPLLTMIGMNACAVVIGALIVIWPALLQADAGVLSGLWPFGALNVAGLGSHGVSHSLSAAIVVAGSFGITLLSLAGFVLGFMQIRDAMGATANDGQRARADKVKAAGRQLDSELNSILLMLRDHLHANESFSEVLAKAYEEAPVTAKPEQVRMVIKHLIAENEKMRRDSNELRLCLEQSKEQIEKLRMSLAEAEEIGLRDPLTNLGNRRSFDINLAKEVSEAQTTGSPLCLVMGDIDHFKRVNDSFGHLVGDELLKMFGNLLASNVKGRDTVARYGGEEFAMILPQTEVSGAKVLTERIRAQFEAKRLALNKNGAQLGRVTASFGIAGLTQDDTPRKLVHRADAKLYEAKCSGRNRIAAD